MVKKQDIFNSLDAMGAPKDSVVLFHCSLRLIGEIEGGAKALLDAMIEYFTAEGGLFCVPTHTWHNLGLDVPTLDMNKAESCLGAFSLLASGDSRGVRSENPTHSMMVFGDRARAADFVRNDEFVDTPTSPDSCYGKLYERRGYVFLCGVSHNKNTYLHTVEEILGLPNRMDTEPVVLTVKRRSGELVERNIRLFKCSFTEDISFRFHKYETAFRHHGYISDGYIGDAPCQLCDAVGMKKVMELIFERAKNYDPLSDEEPLEPKLYVKEKR